VGFVACTASELGVLLVTWHGRARKRARIAAMLQAR
jgi:hypothetical protein